MNTVSYDQFVDIPSLGSKSKIIFSEQIYDYLKSLINQTKLENSEKGCYLVGRQSTTKEGVLCFFFDFCSSPFQTTNGIYANGGVIPTEKNKKELISKLEEYESLGIEPYIMHFHTHNLQGIYSSFSDQDYVVYASMKYILKTRIFGMLAAPNKYNQNETFEISIVNWRDQKLVRSRACANFYLIPNVFYCKGNEIYKVGSFNRSYPSSKKVTNELSRKDRYVQNYQEFKGTQLVSAIGKNPLTQSHIVDASVGYIDNRDNLCFPSENLSLEFPNFQKLNTSSFNM